ncbi:hypothetical protein SAMN05877753_108117 [Bacillus oleivorans]|uniref:Ornithine monooxygenase n=1 Tax=Bacillus oleivorans TaxID=1448271 RepID=A0A285D409_9BACI|nr:VOC family protein [Bacillus oleivorans]SNX74028.1 hypothetical protein SAMN05877753_108117 [Bacillus oleivorans]
MIYEMTIQVRVQDFTKGLYWYTSFLQKEPDFIPHEGFAEWEIIPKCWLQVAQGTPAKGSGPFRVGIDQLEAERKRLVEELGVDYFEIESRPEVPVKWATFSDPWGNLIGLFEYITKEN